MLCCCRESVMHSGPSPGSDSSLLAVLLRDDGASRGPSARRARRHLSLLGLARVASNVERDQSCETEFLRPRTIFSRSKVETQIPLVETKPKRDETIETKTGTKISISGPVRAGINLQAVGLEKDRIVFMQMCILLYYWANKMMMMTWALNTTGVDSSRYSLSDRQRNLCGRSDAIYCRGDCIRLYTTSIYAVALLDLYS